MADQLLIDCRKEEYSSKQRRLPLKNRIINDIITIANSMNKNKKFSSRNKLFCIAHTITVSLLNIFVVSRRLQSTVKQRTLSKYFQNVIKRFLWLKRSSIMQKHFNDDKQLCEVYLAKLVDKYSHLSTAIESYCFLLALETTLWEMQLHEYARSELLVSLSGNFFIVYFKINNRERSLLPLRLINAHLVRKYSEFIRLSKK